MTFQACTPASNQVYEELLRKSLNRLERVAVIGLGYVGLPLALSFAKNSIETIGIDIKTAYIENLRNGHIPYAHLNNIETISILESGFLSLSSDISEVATCDVIIICVPTPLSKNHDPDLSYIVNACHGISTYLKVGQLVVLESTTYPGTTEEVVLPIIESKGLRVGIDIFLSYSPEREDPGNKNYSMAEIPKVVSGVTQKCCDAAVAVYSAIVTRTVAVTSTRTAELTKLVENIHRSVNIGLMNELKPLADKMNIDLFEVIAAASTKPFGFTPYYPGPGLGGHCIPIDPFYLSWKAREYGIRIRFIELAGEINSSMPEYVVLKVSQILNNIRIPLNGAKVLILGVAYKKNVEDIRKSPAIIVLESLIEHGSIITYADPYVPSISIGLSSSLESIMLESISLEKNVFADHDLVLLLTDHDCFRYDDIYEFSKVIVDTRGRYTTDEKVFRA